VTPIVSGLAGVYFLYLAGRIATGPPVAGNSEQRSPPSFAAGVLLSLVNPKRYAATGALFSGFVLVRERLVPDVALKLIVLAAIIATVNVAWLVSGAGLTRFFREPGTNRIINVIFAIC